MEMSKELGENKGEKKGTIRYIVEEKYPNIKNISDFCTLCQTRMYYKGITGATLFTEACTQ